MELANSLTPGSSVLDLGCGAGRNALPLARAGMNVTAVDASQTACARLRAAARDFVTPIHIVELDIRRFEFTRHYDLVIAHGVLHLLPTADRVELLNRIKSSTVSGGVNVIAVFTKRLPTPPDLEAVTFGLFDEGELFDSYKHWNIVLKHAYTLHDRHPGGLNHKHAVNKIVARRPISG